MKLANFFCVLKNGLGVNRSFNYTINCNFDCQPFLHVNHMLIKTIDIKLLHYEWKQ